MSAQAKPEGSRSPLVPPHAGAMKEAFRSQLKPTASDDMGRPGTQDAARTPAGLWVRLLAVALDYVLIAAYLVILIAAGILVSRFAQPVAAALFGGPVSGEATGFLLITAPISLYFALSEASSAQAGYFNSFGSLMGDPDFTQFTSV